MYQKGIKFLLPLALLVLAAGGVWGQATPPAADMATPLKRAFEAAWARQPEARSQDLRTQAALSRRDGAASWTAEPLALEVSGLTDRLDRDEGGREYEVGVSVPLWLPGERAATGALAEAELSANTGRTQAAQLRTAGEVRAAYWEWQRARIEVVIEQERLAGARELAADVARRVQAGDLARADRHQAEGALAGAEVALAGAERTLADALAHFRILTGMSPESVDDDGVQAEPEPARSSPTAATDGPHPAVDEPLARAEVARRAATLANIQRRANPELSLATTRERAAAGEAWEQTVTVGLRIPFGAGARGSARVAEAAAEAVEAETEVALARQRVEGELAAARSRVRAAQAQLVAAEQRARLARESRSFFEKSFRLGETDLPTRLRIDLEATDAARELALARVELGAAVSALRQALGLLPE